jgi:hypothetical protein
MEPTLISTPFPEPPPPPSKSASKKKYLWFLLLIPLCCICVVLIAGGIYYYGTSQPIQVGFYSMEAGVGEGDIEAAIKAAGYTPVALDELTDVSLKSLHVLFILNESNDEYNEDYIQSLDVINAAVKNGMVLVIHDRMVVGSDKASDILPGGTDIEFVRDPGSEVQLFELENSVVNGPGGLLNDDSLDGGNSSVHGYATVNTLPSGAKVILTTDVSSEAVTFWYKYGSGFVIYSSIPLDYYIDESTNADAPDSVGYQFKFVYTPNVIKFAGEQVPFLRRLMAR